MTDSSENENLDNYIRTVENQELKGILLKLKNEMRKPDAPWETIKPVLAAVLRKDKSVLLDILPLILK